MLDPFPLYRELPLKERLFVRARMFSAPLEEVANRAPSGLLVDVGCGHGLLTALLALGRPDRTVIGVDPDERKISWAGRGPGALPNVELRLGGIEELSPQYDGKVDGITVADVLYLLPVPQWPDFLQACRTLLKPGGVLLLKEAEDDGGWKAKKCLAQEVVMVKLIGKTKGSGGLALRPRSYTERLLREAGFTVRETVDLSKGYTTPHVLFVAEASAPASP